MTRALKSVEKRIDGIIRSIRKSFEDLSQIASIKDLQLVVNVFKEQIDAQAEKIEQSRVQLASEVGQESVEPVHPAQEEAGQV